LFLGAGILMLLIALYAAGTENMTCSWKRESLNCVVERFRLVGAYCAERKYAIKVTDVFVRTSTTSNTYLTPSKSRETTTTTNDTLILRTRGGEDIETLGGEKSPEFAERVEAMLKDPKQPPLILVDSNWPFSYVLGGLALVFVTFGAVAIRFANR
jgi:hypothetical protein